MAICKPASSEVLGISSELWFLAILASEVILFLWTSDPHINVCPFLCQRQSRSGLSGGHVLSNGDAMARCPAALLLPRASVLQHMNFLAPDSVFPVMIPCLFGSAYRHILDLRAAVGAKDRVRSSRAASAHLHTH